MRVLLIGGTGNISSDCAALLHARGHEVILLTRGKSAAPSHYRQVHAERKDVAAVRQALAGVNPEVVIDFIAYEAVDVTTAFEVFRDAVQQYIFISSTTVYSRPAPLPLTEQTARGNEWWDYARRKIDCELWLGEHSDRSRFPVTIVRPSHTYSKRWIPNPISSSSFTFAQRLELGKPVYILDNGENPWTLTAATDFAAGLEGLVGNPAAIGEAFHITSDEVLGWNEIYAEIAGALGVSMPYIVRVPTDFVCEIAPEMTGTLKGDKSHPGIFDNSKIKRVVPDFKCVKPFRIGIRESVNWLRAHPEDQNLNPSVDAVCDRVVGAWKGQNDAPH